MIVSMIAAMSESRVIGIHNQLPWHLPEDLAWFKKNTMNKPVIMGRKTWESLPIKPLPGRKHMIITRDSNYQPFKDGKISSEVNIVSSIEEAILQQDESVKEVMIIGGASIYEQALPICNRLYLTNIHYTYEGDAYFPDYQKYQWHQSYIESNETQGKETFKYDFLILEKPEFK
ncbi:MAG: type 3 dihydrofolate reductase [Gammaproteobacteria bacterium]|nr:type 3 dihydrofolate reductase [Gammaproteobacteria bacterium]